MADASDKTQYSINVEKDGFSVVQIRDGAIYLRLRRWSDDAAAAFKRYGATNVIIEQEFPGTPRDWSRLVEHAEHIRELQVGESPKRDLSFVSDLVNLAELSVAQKLDAIDFSRLTKLREVSVDKPSDLARIVLAPSLERLILWGAKAKSLAPLAGAKKLKQLQVRQEDGITSLAGMETLVTLEELDLVYNRRLTSVKALNHLPKLKRLSWDGSRNVTDLEKLDDLPALTRLHIISGPAIKSFKFLRGSPRLEYLGLQNVNIASKKCSVAPIAGLRHLKYLSFWTGPAKGFGSLTDMKMLGQLSKLEELTITRGPRLESLDFFRGLRKLRELTLGATEVGDGKFEVLYDLPQLRKAEVYPVKKHYDMSPLHRPKKFPATK